MGSCSELGLESLEADFLQRVAYDDESSVTLTPRKNPRDDEDLTEYE